MILTRSASIFKENFNIPARNVCFPAQLLQLAGARRLIFLESLHEDSLGRVADSDNLVFPLPRFFHFTRHKAKLSTLARFVFRKLQPLCQAVCNGHGRLGPELKALKVANEVVRECITVVGVGSETLSGLLLSETECAPARLELVNKVPDAVQVVAVRLVHGPELVVVVMVEVV